MIKLQQAIIDKLLNSPSVQTALGFNAPATGGVSEDMSFNLENATYPRIHIGLNSMSPKQYQQMYLIAGKGVKTVYFDLIVFSKKKTSMETGNIEQAAAEALEGARFNFPNLCVYNVEVDSFVLKDRDTETGVWHSITRYRALARLT